MLLPPLLRAHGFMRTEAPPAIWEARTEDTDFVPLLGEMIAAALRTGYPLSTLTLAAANVVIPVDLAAEDGLVSVPPAGDYVAVTVAGPGSWSTDWRWLPAHNARPEDIPLPLSRLVAAKVHFAYGRALGATSSVTVFLARQGPVPLSPSEG